MNTKRWLAMLLFAFIMAAPTVAQRGGLVYHECQVVDEFGRKVTDITSVTVYAPGTTTASTIYMDSALASAITQPMTTSSTNTTLADGKFYWWGPESWDYTVTDGTNTHTNNGHNAMSASMSRIVFPSYLQSISSTTYSDSQSATFGSDSDFVLQGGATGDRFTVTPNATDESAAWWFGANTSGVDVFFYAATSGDYVLWDASDEALEAVGAQVHLDDDSDLQIGTDKDWSIDSDTTKVLDFIPLAADETYIINIGADEGGADFKLFAATTGDYALWDASDEQFELVGAQVLLDDDSDLIFGSGSDFTVDSDTDKTLDFTPAGSTDNYIINLGADQSGVDLKIFGATTGEYWSYDASADSILANTGNALYTMTDAEANQFKVDATGTVAGDAIVLETTNGGIQLNADGSDNGDIEVNSNDDIELTATGDIIVTVGGDFSIVDADILAWGTDDDITSTFDGTDFLLDASTADEGFKIGDTTTGFNLCYYYETSGTISTDYDGDLITIDGSDMRINDDDLLYFGDSNEVAIEYQEDDSDAFKIDCTKTVAGNALTLETSNGGINLNADGADNGDIDLDAADDMTITAAGDITLSVGGTLKGGGATIDNIYRTTEVVAGTSDTLTATQSGQIIVYTQTGGSCTVTLPEATAAEVGVWYILIDGNPAAGNDLAIDPEGEGTINGDAAGHKITCENDRDGEGILIFCTAADTWYTMACGSSTVWTEE